MPEKKQTFLAMDDTESNIDTLLELNALTKSLLDVSDLALWNMQEEWRSNPV
jgi:hypothetical protein